MSLHDVRSLFGAIALIITGIILATMLYQYLNVVEGALSRSRLWWEIVLNVQILSAAMMWFCYSDRIENSTGAVKRLQIIRLWFTIVTVLLPTFFGVAGVGFNWFEYEPSPLLISLFCAAVFLYWLLGLWVHMRVQKKRSNPNRPASGLFYAATYSPIILLLLISVFDAPQGGVFWLYAIPVLTYIQGAMPFIVKAFGLRS
ncbi:hypothetical protein [Kordiimonas aquimaris]|uniref:hypothetical protein n=1 Tax=Kordiimonas aquimaris TaxID=707591 RepID=UPI0021D0B169|nr:hypothetical protein [Kordiimonas aquimaris]